MVVKIGFAGIGVTAVAGVAAVTGVASEVPHGLPDRSGTGMLIPRTLHNLNPFAFSRAEVQPIGTPAVVNWSI